MPFRSPFAMTAAAALVASSPAQAVVLTQWNFNSPVADASTATGTILPSIGTGTASLVGGVSATFASGDANGGSTDPNLGDDAGWNTTAYPAQGAGSKTAGAQFTSSTAGFANVSLSFDQRHSNTASAFVQVQYTVNGSTWIDAAGGLFQTSAGDVWNNGRTVDLSSAAGVNDNASFGVRIVSAFAPSITAYAAANASSTYSGAGTLRLDQVTLIATPVPEPGTSALLLAGLASIGFVASRRQRR